MTSNNIFKEISDLDLSAIKSKLMHKASGQGWSAAKADAIEIEYKRFLHLMLKFPTEQTAPRIDVDIFWHYHILDTMKYAADCEQVFGYFLHHYPYIGMEGADDDQQVHQAAGERMREMYETTFGEIYLRQFAPAEQAATAYCGAPPAATAYCGATSGAKAAYCGATSGARSAYCGVNASPKSAYCGASTRAETAYCGASAMSAYCGASAKTAYCGASTGAEPAYCGATAGAACPESMGAAPAPGAKHG